MSARGDVAELVELAVVFWQGVGLEQHRAGLLFSRGVVSSQGSPQEVLVVMAAAPADLMRSRKCSEENN